MTRSSHGHDVDLVAARYEVGANSISVPRPSGDVRTAVKKEDQSGSHLPDPAT